MEHTKGTWVNGNTMGITGPTTPTHIPTVTESVEYYRWERNGAEGEEPQPQHTVITVGTQTVAIVPTCIPEGKANARHICKCVNSHDDLLAACEELLEFTVASPSCSQMLDRAKAAIAAAESHEPNELTAETLKKTDEGKDLHRTDSVEKLIKELDND